MLSESSMPVDIPSEPVCKRCQQQHRQADKDPLFNLTAIHQQENNEIAQLAYLKAAAVEDQTVTWLQHKSSKQANDLRFGIANTFWTKYLCHINEAALPNAHVSRIGWRDDLVELSVPHATDSKQAHV
jgi:hypothetical protein